MRHLIHNGVLVPKHDWKRLHINVKAQRIGLTPEQEEMAVAFARKMGTPYINDEVFVRNFLKDFCKALNMREKVSIEDFDFSPVLQLVERERMLRLGLSKEEKKLLAEQRKEEREAARDKYGYAMVDSVRTEISNYVVEPSSIFMGRGEHPLRGMWKPGAKEEDVILNLSPGAPIPNGNWKAIVWQPEAMWVAKWTDKLTGKMKYVWLSDNCYIRQAADIMKFNKAIELASKIDEVREHIAANLDSRDYLRRKTATVCYLIDVLKLRVGDEKNRDEADTVGATTLRPEHIKTKSDGLVTFDFLGKDAVRWRKEVKLPENVINNLEDSMGEAESSIFKGVRSKNTSLFLDEVMPGLTAKVFRTYHASKVVKEFLAKIPVKTDDAKYVKKSTATLANLQAAIVCNHKRKPPKNWTESLRKKRERLRKLRGKRTKRAGEAAKALSLRIKVMRMVRDYNLGTSLKSYIDPRIYYRWSKKVDYDWKLYYPKALRRKFSWVETLTERGDGPQES